MRTYRWIGFVVTLAALAMPAIAAAQKFQEPTKEELQMTSDPKAPDAPAVYLYLEEKMDNETHTVNRYGRIKVLTEKGKEYATVEITYPSDYNGTPIIEARTIHSDGTIIPLQGKVAELLVVKTTTESEKRAVFNMPAVEVGSILEYRWTLPMFAWGESPRWDVQKPIFVHKAHFFYNPIDVYSKSISFGPKVTEAWVPGDRIGILLYAPRLPAGYQVVRSQAGDYTLDIQDVPAIQHEPDAPPEEATRYCVRFYFTPFTIPITFWKEEGARWSRELDSFAAVTNEVKSAAAQIIAGAATNEAKARKLYDAVQAMDNTDFSREKTEAERHQLHLKKELKKADDVLREKSGSGNDLAALYLALARAAGLQADGVKIASRDKQIFDTNYLTLYQLDTLLVVLHLDGKDVYVDPGEKLCPFGQLHWSHILAGGLQQNLSGPTYTPANLTKDAITAHAADLAVDSSGNVTGTVQLVMNGPAALHWRQLNLTEGSEEVKRRVTESLHQLLPGGMNADITGIKGLETPEGFVQVSTKISGQAGNVTGKRILLPAFFFSTAALAQFVSEKSREFPVDLQYAEQVIDDVIYHLPTGFTVESSPPAVQLPWPDHATVVVKVTANGGTLDVRHTFARAFVLLDAKEYPALHDYYGKLAASDQQQVVLAQAPAATAH